MNSFVSIVALPAVQQVSEKGIFGKPFVRLGRLYIVIGCWVFQQGGVLGYSFRDYPTLLGKFLPRIDPEVAVEYLNNLREVITGYLAKSEGQENDFYQLYIVRELRELGIDITAWPPSKALETRVSPEMASNTMVIAFNEGAAFGYHFPELFKEYWDNTYQMRPDSEWQKMRAQGLKLSEVQQSRPLGTAISEVAEMALLWAEEEATQLLDSHEVQLLKKLAVSSGDPSH